ncbi:uncharacterized protein LOC141858121 [Brevipalpus obovatus]|uniref:uncharacterized protein LOC141858121 n=1 Tax=Brevipalpus obovatus TaxID=246614 RepID=UPI003D9EA3D8
MLSSRFEMECLKFVLLMFIVAFHSVRPVDLRSTHRGDKNIQIHVSEPLGYPSNGLKSMVEIMSPIITAMKGAMGKMCLSLKLPICPKEEEEEEERDEPGSEFFGIPSIGKIKNHNIVMNIMRKFGPKIMGEFVKEEGEMMMEG